MKQVNQLQIVLEENLREYLLVELEMKQKLEAIEELMLGLYLASLFKLCVSANLRIPLFYQMKSIKLIEIIEVIHQVLYLKFLIQIRIRLLLIIIQLYLLIFLMLCLLQQQINQIQFKDLYSIEWKSYKFRVILLMKKEKLPTNI